MKDLTNQRFGRQIAVMPCGKNKYGNMLWLCKCDCGAEHIVASGKLIQGKSKSCGCYKRDICTEQLKKHGITRVHQRKTRFIEIWGIELSTSGWCKEIRMSKSSALKLLSKSEDSFKDEAKKRILAGKGQLYFINKFLNEDETKKE